VDDDLGGFRMIPEVALAHFLFKFAPALLFWWGSQRESRIAMIRALRPSIDCGRFS